ncbi:unnamed protein product [Acanthoscelides obtectus]|uniref:MADF domain-containing protein n=1 Tax=Acanthoscelides obtectus TaxID=200917 RepID=A0A9P0L8E6_ACAOB|nr:unnamed protein product [Acanthoscelides obtectus]CAK1671499.1 hypothetical protein AOBTE_LOCUS28278 [Acanthoscelides obtectus]
MTEYDIDIELFITLVQEHPVIWDRSDKDYKHRNPTAQAWRDICSVLVENYSSEDEYKKSQISNTVHRKWTNLKDSWIRCFKKDIELRKSGRNKSRKYIYHDQMAFLRKNFVETNGSESSLTEENDPGTKPFMDDSNSQIYTLTFPQSPVENECEVDVELLISLVAERPAIWDRTHRYYKHKKASAQAWKEICTIVVDQYMKAEDTEKVQICRTVQRKWTNIRDTWTKFVKKEADMRKSGITPTNLKKYTYHDNLFFLQRNLQNNNAPSNTMDAKELSLQNSTDDSNEHTNVNTSNSNRKRNNDPFETQNFGVANINDELDAKDVGYINFTDDSSDALRSTRTQSPVNNSQIRMGSTCNTKKMRFTQAEEVELGENRHMCFFRDESLVHYKGYKEISVELKLIG